MHKTPLLKVIQALQQEPKTSMTINTTQLQNQQNHTKPITKT
jgi:hypothetical protein